MGGRPRFLSRHRQETEGCRRQLGRRQRKAGIRREACRGKQAHAEENRMRIGDRHMQQAESGSRLKMGRRHRQQVQARDVGGSRGKQQQRHEGC